VRGFGGEIYRGFTIVNVIAARMTPRAADALARNPAVAYVEVDGPVYAVEQTVPWGIDRVFGAETYPFDTWSESTGYGIGVAVLDTGICENHEDLTVHGGTNTIDGTHWGSDGYGHGTHVAGTIAALDNTFGVVGVSPSAMLYAVKVLDDTGSGTDSSVAAGIEWAVNNNIPLLNMSLGSTRRSQTLKAACDNAYAAGHLLVSSAGNEGQGRDTVTYPAKHDSVIAVAASDIGDALASFSSTGPTVELIAPGADILSTIPWTDDNSLTVDGVSYQANWIENAARTDASGVTAPLVHGGLALTTNPEWYGEVVLVERGEISFYEKVMNVQESGGVAAVIYNNEPGNFYGTLGEDNSSTIPAISLSQEDGQSLVANKLGVDGTVVSLYDPTTPGYAAWSGTSMASPHVAGVAALVWAAGPGLSNAQVRAILQQTAEDLLLPADHQGYGLVRADLAVAAVQAPATYTITATAGTGGAIDPSGEVIVNEGDSQTFTITAYTDYEIEDVLVDGISQGAITSYTFENVTADHTIHATFSYVGAGGTVRVESVTYTTRGGRYGDKHLDVTLLLLNDLDQPVADALVSATLSCDTGDNWNFQGATGSDGTVTFTLISHGSGCYSTEVTSVEVTGLTWDGITPANSYCK
jgi:serine protease